MGTQHGANERGPRSAGEDARQRLLAGIDVTERRLQLAGVSTAVLEAGGGPPLVLLQGGIECGGVYWAPVISRLAESHRLIVPDVPGLGESEPVERLDATAFADWFAELLRETCEQKPTLIAHSLGGSLAARFAAAHGDLLRRLVIYAAPGIGPYRMPLGLRVVAIRFGLRPSERNAERFDRWAFFDFDQARRRDPAWFEDFSAYTRLRAAVSHVKRTMGQLIKTGTKQILDTELRRIAVPTALIWGSHDRFVSPDLAKGASARLGWPLHVIDDTGHVPHIERNDAFVDALHSALGEKSQAPSSDSSPERIGSAHQRAADGVSVPRTG
jgi:pimeloyl-ACP methyl ester carboxylesterase